MTIDQKIRLLTYEEVAGVLGYGDKRSVANLVRAGHLPNVVLSAREFRVRYVDLEAFIAAGGIRAAAVSDDEN